MMNWKEIKEKYPKAWAKAVEWKGELKLKMLFLSVNMYRDLYDFFDEQEIYVYVVYNSTNNYWSFDCIQYMIYGEHNPQNKGLWINEKPLYFNKQPRLNTRKEAEETAFMKAFEILEERLSPNTGK